MQFHSSQFFYQLTCLAGSKINIPELKNSNATDTPNHSLLNSFLDRFDIVIELSNYSNWRADESLKALAHFVSGWYKIDMKMPRMNFDSFTTSQTIIRMDTKIGDTIWNVLRRNHLFEIEDERIKELPCKKTKIVKRYGKADTVDTSYMIYDGPEYEFEILTNSAYKKLYFYAPKEFHENCPEMNERKWIVECISAFEKYLGI